MKDTNNGAAANILKCSIEVEQVGNTYNTIIVLMTASHPAHRICCGVSMYCGLIMAREGLETLVFPTV